MQNLTALEIVHHLCSSGRLGDIYLTIDDQCTVSKALRSSWYPVFDHTGLRLVLTRAMNGIRKTLLLRLNHDGKPFIIFQVSDSHGTTKMKLEGKIDQWRLGDIEKSLLPDAVDLSPAGLGQLFRCYGGEENSETIRQFTSLANLPRDLAPAVQELLRHDFKPSINESFIPQLSGVTKEGKVHVEFYNPALHAAAMDDKFCMKARAPELTKWSFSYRGLEDLLQRLKAHRR